MHPVKTKISLDNYPVLIDSSLLAYVHCEDPDQTGQISRLIWVFAGFVESWIIIWAKTCKPGLLSVAHELLQ